MSGAVKGEEEAEESLVQPGLNVICGKIKRFYCLPLG